MDDFHLAHPSLARVRGVLTNFIDSEMGPYDQAAIHSTSGQIGFLQQLTSRAALRAAVARLENRERAAVDMDRPPMTAYHAYTIEGRSDRGLLDFFVTETMRRNPGLPREAAENIVIGRARHLVAESTAITQNTLIAVEELVRSAVELPGRKLVFFISDGFVTDLSASDTSNRLQRIADAAARSRAVMYTMDARGLATQPGFDASGPAAFDPTGIVNRADSHGRSASQEPLHRLAADTGAR